MATKNNINETSDPFTINPASGDPYVQFNINTTNEYRVGVDDGDGDAFKVSQGGALGTNDHLIVESDGIITYPLNPAFVNTLNSEASVTGDGTVHDFGSVTATTSVIDRGSNMADGNGSGTPATFTAPVTGLYYLRWSFYANGNPVPIWYGYVTTSNRTYRFMNFCGRSSGFDFFVSGGRIAYNGAIIADMDASDTAIWYYVGASGTKNSTNIGVNISGYLIG